MVCHHDQVSVPKIAKRTPQLHEPITVPLCDIEHDPALELVRVVQLAIRVQPVLGIDFDRDLLRRSSGALDGSERHVSKSAPRDETIHVELVRAIGEEWMQWTDAVRADPQ